MTESKGIHETFIDYLDAHNFLEKHLVEMAKAGWELQPGSGIQYIEDEWSVGMGWRKVISPLSDEISKIEGMLQ